MERLCGKVDYRKSKLKKLDAVSRSIILDSTGNLRKDSRESFRSFRKKAEEVQELKMSWSAKMKDRFAAKLTTKQAVAANKEEKRLQMLEKLKCFGGPFTMSEQVEQFLNAAEKKQELEVNPKLKEKIRKETALRMKTELQFARESSTTLPKSDPIFKIMVVVPNQKRRDKTAEEFGVSLKALYGKRAGKIALSLDKFKQSLENISKS